MKATNKFLYVLQNDNEPTLSGFEIPNEKINSGIIRQVGRDVSDVKVGDLVFFSKFANVVDSIVDNGENLLVIHESGLELIINQ